MSDLAEEEMPVNVYDLLGLKEGDPVQALLEDVALLKAHWEPRENRPGAMGETARANLDAIQIAERVFTDENSRRAYDHQLRGEPESADGYLNPNKPIQDSDNAMSAPQQHILTLVPAPVLTQDSAPTLSASNSATEGESGMVNLYDVLGLDRGATTESIRAQIQDALRPNCESRARRAGRRGQEARDTLKHLDRADTVFASDEARSEYDRQLRRRPETKPEDASLDWTSITWNYYWQDDIGAAVVAARKAREQHPQDPRPYVVSAWVDLAQNEVKRAKDHADEAYVLDEFGEDSADVQLVRGVTFHQLGQFSKALDSFDRALARSTPDEAPEIYWRKAMACEGQGDADGMVTCCALALSTETEFRADLEAMLRRAIAKRCYVKNNPDESAARYSMERSGLEASGIQMTSKQTLIAFATERINLLRQITQLLSRISWSENRMAFLETIKYPKHPKPDLLPAILWSSGVGAFLILLSGISIIFTAIGLCLLGYAAFTFQQLSRWNAEEKSAEQAGNERSSLFIQLSDLRNRELVNLLDEERRALPLPMRRK